MAKAKSLETAFEELDALIVRMEDKDIPLEEAFKLYQEGLKLLKYCNGAIDKVEKKIIEIHGDEEAE
ncbi:MAG: exodeoxyribonuclease VII small subunit [Coprococcus sp.]